MSVVSLARMARVTGPSAKRPRRASSSPLAAETSMTSTAPARTISSMEPRWAVRVFSPPRSAGPAAATPSAMSLSPASAMTKSAGVKDPERIRESFRSRVFMLGASGAWRDARLRAAPDARQAPQTKAATGGGVDSAPAALSNAGIASPQGGFPKRAAACSEHAATPGRGFGARGFPEEIMTLHSRSAIWLLAAVAVLVAGTAGPARAADVFIGLITKTDSNPFFVKMREGADATAKKVGARVQSFAGKFDGDNDTQVAAIENLISAGAKGSAEGGRTGMETLLQKDPSINVVYTINEPTAAGAYEALKAAGKADGSVLVVSVDGGCPGVKNVKAGVIGATSQQYPLLMASKGVEAVVEFAKTGKKPKPTPGLKFFDTGVQLITDKPVQGLKSINTAEGLKLCWG